MRTVLTRAVIGNLIWHCARVHLGREELAEAAVVAFERVGFLKGLVPATLSVDPIPERIQNNTFHGQLKCGGQTS